MFFGVASVKRFLVVWWKSPEGFSEGFFGCFLVNFAGYFFFGVFLERSRKGRECKTMGRGKKGRRAEDGVFCFLGKVVCFIFWVDNCLVV